LEKKTEMKDWNREREVKMERNGNTVLLSYATSVLAFSCFVDRASLYNLANKANLLRNLFLVYQTVIHTE
jgi:hypothetical protein